MKESCKKILQSVYDCWQNSSKAYFISPNTAITPEEKYGLLNDVKFLIENGYVQEDPPMSSGYMLKITANGEHFVENNFRVPNVPTSNVFNIQNATNSIIGTQSNVTMNIGDTIKKTREQINSSSSTDKEELQEIINLLEKVVNGQTPVKKGLLSKFSDAIQKNSWITSPITSILLNWLMLH